MKDLPPGWTSVPLMELVEATRPRVNPKEADGLPFIGMDQVESQTMRLLGTVPASMMKSAGVRFEPGDVLYGRLRPYLNKVYRPAFNGLGSAEFIVLTPSPHLDGDYLSYLLNSAHFVRFASGLNTGDRPRVDFKQIGTYPVPLPGLEVQRQIVETIDKQMSRLAAGSGELRTAQRRLRTFRSRVLSAAIDDHDGWEVVQLGDVLQSMRNGLSHKPEGEEGVRILRISAVRPMAVDLDDVRYLDPSKADAKFLLQPDDLLFTRYNGNPELVGVCGRVREVRAPTLHPDKVIRARVDDARVLPAYMEIALNTGMARRHIRQSTKTTAGQAGVAGSDLKRTPVPLPPLAHQELVAEAVNSRLAVAAEVSKWLVAAELRAGSLRRSVLAAAFLGQLHTLA